MKTICKKLIKLTVVCGLVILCPQTSWAGLSLPQLFQSGMVLQRGKPVPVWGWADCGQQISLTFNKKTYTTVADSTGQWRIDLPVMKAGGPYTLSVECSPSASDSSENSAQERLEFTDVMVGDVWLLSGQSNIDVTIERVYPQYVKEIDSYENSSIRLFRVQNDTDTRGVKSDIRPTAINWKPLNKQNAWPFSAVGYFLGKRMYEKTRVAQGIIVNSWGGTPIEAWVSADSLHQEFPLLVEKTRLYQNDDYVRAQQRANMLVSQQWNKLLDELDPGINSKMGADGKEVKDYLFSQLDYDDSKWREVNQYDMEWAKLDGRGIIGSIWLRQHLTVDKEHAGKPARLLLGTLFDADVTYVNGQQVGSTGYQYPPRRYDLPEGLLREGDNVITIRFINKYGTVHFIKEKPYLIAFGNDRFSLNPMPTDFIRLSETWKHHGGTLMPLCPSSDVSLQNLPTTLYNAVVHPLAPYALSGVVWYQGESNVNNPAPYENLLTKLITGWRQLWKQPQLPFVVVQLANYLQPSDKPQESSWARVREAQRLTAEKLLAVELASPIDLGETVDIHPLRKKELAERIGLGFDRLVYNDKRVRLMPKLKSTATDGNLITLTFDQPLKPGELQEFEVAGADGRFVNALATAKDNSITLSSTVSQPVWVRHAWKDNPIKLNAYALTGLPVPPFEVKVGK